MSKNTLSQLNVVGFYTITLDDKVISYTLKRSLKAKFIWLRIKRPAILSVTVPRRYNIKSLPAFLKTHSRWILLNLAKYGAETAAITLNYHGPYLVTISR
jgi:predicted metal-dependent hydrolase